jgi:hypothetical protein
VPDGSEPNAGGTFNFDSGRGGQGRFSRAVRAFGGGSAQASLKFDIPGLQAFRREITGIGTDLAKLRDEFNKLSKAPKDFATQLAEVNRQLVALKTNMGNAKGAGFGTPATSLMSSSPSVATMSPMAQTPTSGGMAGSFVQGFMGGGGMSGGLSAMGGGGSLVSTVTNLIGSAIQQGTQLAMGRFTSNMAVTGAYDIAGSRMALSSGVSSANQMGMISRQAPFYGSLPDIGQALLQQSQLGNVYGGTGMAGQRGSMAAQNILSLQNLMPGMSDTQASGMLAAQQQNVRGINQARMVFGNAITPTGPGGAPRAQKDIYKALLDSIVRQAHNGVPYTKDQLLAQRMPGSNIYSWLAQTGWSDDQVQVWFDWAIGQATYDVTGKKTFDPSRDINSVRPGGASLATSMQQTETAQAQREANMGNAQYGSYMDFQSASRGLITALTKLDDTMNLVYKGIGKTGPLAGNVGNALGGAVKGAGIGATIGTIIEPGGGTVVGGLIGGAVGGLASMVGIGDPRDGGLSQMNPDVRKRVQTMMAANPNLRMNSGYRTSMQQKRLYDSGNPNVAPPGRGQHTKGNAADIGPASQYGWLAKNAKRFGLDTAGHLGEPWHVQVAGTLGIGDAQTDALHQWSAQTAAEHNAFLIASAAANGGSGAGGSSASAVTAPASAGTTGATAVSSGTVGLDVVGKALYQAGFRGNDLINMMAIPSRESSYDTGVHNLNPKTGDDSWGLWQINVAPGANAGTLKDVTGSADPTQLTDPYTAAKVAYAMYQRSGNTLNPWGGYKGESNTYNVSDDAINAARQTAQSLWPSGYGDPPGGGGGNGGSTTVSNTPITFNATFNISGGGGGAGLDLDGLARQLAPKIESVVRRAVSSSR